MKQSCVWYEICDRKQKKKKKKKRVSDSKGGQTGLVHLRISSMVRVLGRLDYKENPR